MCTDAVLQSQCKNAADLSKTLVNHRKQRCHQEVPTGRWNVLLLTSETAREPFYTWWKYDFGVATLENSGEGSLKV